MLAIDKTGSALLPTCESAEPGQARIRLAPMDGEDTRREWPIESQARKPLYGYLSEMFKEARMQLAAGEVDRIMLFVHGGMNDLGGATARAINMRMVLHDARIYPIFIAWDSDPVSTYTDHLVSIRNGKRNPLLGIVTIPEQLLADVGGAVLHAPLDIFSLLGNDLYALSPNSFHEWRYANRQFDTLRAAEVRSAKSGLRPAAVQISEDQDKRGPLKITGDVAKWTVTVPFKIVTTPVIASLGRPAWSNMLRRTRTMYERESEYVAAKPPITFDKSWVDKEVSATELRLYRGYEKHEKQFAFTGREGAMEAFLEQFVKEMPPGNRVRIDAIGHSMGTIVLNNALMRHPEIRFQNLVYLAAACSVSDFKHAVIPYLLVHQRDDVHFYNLCLHPSCERSEQNPGSLDLTARGSLLVWIDTFLSGPESEQDRTYGRWENCVLQATGADIPSKVAGMITIKAFGRDRPPVIDPQLHGARLYDPQAHGQFAEYDQHRKIIYWAEKFWNIETGPPSEVVGYY